MIDYPLSKLLMEKVRSKRDLKPREILLLILGSPIWLPPVIISLAAVFSVYIAVCAVVISMWAVGASSEVVSLILAAWGVLIVIQGNTPAGAAVLGAGISGVGFSALTFLGSRAATKGLRALTGRVFFGIKKRLVGTEQGVM